ncbi:hypothetical protein [uncultured Aquimarina sp.]|uniref:hypothetical protein n=1 Tax=uncultured Aquimarina sp. TaxID=575652 RepID=UPI00262BA911|nr:hypothetical protein [uncultured Aquimarina sp.]
MKKSYILLCSIITMVYATASANKLESVDPVIEILESYIDLMNSIEKDNSVSEVLALYSEQYSGNTTYVKLSGAIVKKNYTKDNIRFQLNDIVQDGNYSLKIKTNKILYSTQKETAGTVSALLDFESIIDDKIAEKGTILMNIVAVQQKGQWKITQNNMVRVSELKDIGDCVCHIFEKGSTQFVTELYYPAGVKYDHKFEAFRITSNEENRIVKSGGKVFVWENNSNKLTLNQKELGVVKTPKQMVQLLIQKMNTETCASIIFR